MSVEEGSPELAWEAFLRLLERPRGLSESDPVEARELGPGPDSSDCEARRTRRRMSSTDSAWDEGDSAAVPTASCVSGEPFFGESSDESESLILIALRALDEASNAAAFFKMSRPASVRGEGAAIRAVSAAEQEVWRHERSPRTSRVPPPQVNGLALPAAERTSACSSSGESTSGSGRVNS
jgi:hypothetical protein